MTVAATELPSIETAAPPQFGGPEGVWSPETLLCASVADCFVLTFRAISRAARFDWLQLDCQVEGALERAAGATRFTRFTTTARLVTPEGADVSRARELLERAEHGCLIANSLSGSRELKAEITIDHQAA